MNITQFKYTDNKDSNKLHLDKYYTSDELAQYCIDVARRILKGKEITEVIDPSAGSGAFSKKIKNCIGYDIEPEHESVIKQDFMTLDLDYKKGRLFITNPPFGVRMILVKRFFKRFVEFGDYIALILPISQLNNKYSSMYEFNLIHSEDLGEQNYSGRNIHCCFNIYERPKNGLNKMPKAELEDITILREHSKGFHECSNYDIRMCYWGNGSAGKIITDPNETYSGEWKITIHKPEIKQKVVEALKRADWHKEIPKVAMLKIQKYHLIEYLKREIPEIC